MTQRPWFAMVLMALVTALLAAHGAAAAAGGRQSADRLVFVQTNEPAGNRILVYTVGGTGQLTPAGTYATGGNGAHALPGTESDTLASQGSLVYEAENELLLAVNAGSDSVSTFSVHGDRLELEDVVASGGEFPASIAIHDRIVYVLNAGGTGIVQGFRIAGHQLKPIPDSARSLGLANTDPPNFLMSPGQVGFTPDGRQLIVTTKASGSMIDVFDVGPNGRLSAAPTQNVSATPVPFAFTFTPTGRLAMAEAGASALTTYIVNPDGTVSDPKSQPDGQMALCWILRVGEYYYVSNTASNTISAYTIAADGQPALVGATGVVAATAPGPIDLTSPSGTAFLYGQTGSGTIGEYQVNANGTLTPLGTVTGLPPGMEGIAST
jgi:6-phosphogluconolactonase (cycloisomerase 2 family)